MKADDPALLHFIRRAMVARIATLSRSGRPSVTSLYFVPMDGHVWLGTSDWTLAAREVKADSRVSVLLQVEREPKEQRILRVTGSAVVRTDATTMRASDLRMAFKYILSPGGIRNHLENLGLLQLTRRYHAQSSEKGSPCVIDVTPERFEFLQIE